MYGILKVPPVKRSHRKQQCHFEKSERMRKDRNAGKNNNNNSKFLKSNEIARIFIKCDDSSKFQMSVCMQYACGWHEDGVPE